MSRTPTSSYYAKQLTLKYKFAFFVFLPGLICFVIFPADCFVALFAFNVSHDMPTCSHITLHRFGLFDVHHRREEEGFAMLASEVPRNYVVEISEVGFAVLRLRIVVSIEAFEKVIESDSEGRGRTLQPKILAEFR